MFLSLKVSVGISSSLFGFSSVEDCDNGEIGEGQTPFSSFISRFTNFPYESFNAESLDRLFKEAGDATRFLWFSRPQSLERLLPAIT